MVLAVVGFGAAWLGTLEGSDLLMSSDMVISISNSSELHLTLRPSTSEWLLASVLSNVHNKVSLLRCEMSTYLAFGIDKGAHMNISLILANLRNMFCHFNLCIFYFLMIICAGLFVKYDTNYSIKV